MVYLKYSVPESCLHVKLIMGGGEQSNSATYFVVLKNWSERKGKEHTAAAIVNRFNGEAYMTIQAAEVFAMVPPAIPDRKSVV